MSRVVVILDRARDDLQAGRDFYEGCDFGVGEYFIDCLLSDVASLQFYFGLHRKHYGYYRLLSKRFPFAVYYDVIDDIVHVVAVLDMRMRPSTIRTMVVGRRRQQGGAE